MSKMGRIESDTDPNTVTILHKRGPIQKTLKTPSVSNILYLIFNFSFSFFLSSPYHYWLDSLHWLLALGKYVGGKYLLVMGV